MIFLCSFDYLFSGFNRQEYNEAIASSDTAHTCTIDDEYFRMVCTTIIYIHSENDVWINVKKCEEKKSQNRWHSWKSLWLYWWFSISASAQYGFHRIACSLSNWSTPNASRLDLAEHRSHRSRFIFHVFHSHSFDSNWERVCERELWGSVELCESPHAHNDDRRLQLGVVETKATTKNFIIWIKTINKCTEWKFHMAKCRISHAKPCRTNASRQCRLLIQINVQSIHIVWHIEKWLCNLIVPVRPVVQPAENHTWIHALNAGTGDTYVYCDCVVCFPRETTGILLNPRTRSTRIDQNDSPVYIDKPGNSVWVGINRIPFVPHGLLLPPLPIQLPHLADLYFVESWCTNTRTRVLCIGELQQIKTRRLKKAKCQILTYAQK